jgi:hypothetical protein
LRQRLTDALLTTEAPRRLHLAPTGVGDAADGVIDR